MFRGVIENVLCRKGKNSLRDSQKLQGPLEDPVGPHEGQRLAMDPLKVISCVGFSLFVHEIEIL